MSVSEQDVRRQIAEMQEAIESAQASRRTGTIVRAIGVVVGFIIVILFVWLGVYNPFQRVAEQPEELREAFRVRLATIDAQEKLQRISQELTPVYMPMVAQAATDVGLADAAREQARMLWTDLQPELNERLPQIRSGLRVAVEDEMRSAVNELQRRVDRLLQRRLASAIRAQEARIRGEVDLDEQEVEALLTRIVEANRQALLNMVERRWSRSQAALTDIQNMVDELPKLPPMSEQELLDHTVRTLVALLKHKLPDYDLQAQLREAPPTRTRRRTAEPAETPTADHRERMIEELEQKLQDADLPEKGKDAIRLEIIKMLDAQIKDFRQRLQSDEGLPEATTEELRRLIEEAGERRRQLQQEVEE